MPQFQYKAKDSNGKVYTGTLEADDRFEVYSRVREEGSVIVNVEERSGSSWRAWLNVDRINAFLSSVSTRDLVMFARNLSTMLEAGLALSRGLEVLQRQTKNPKLKQVLTKMNADVQRGQNLHEVMKQFPDSFPPLMTAMVKAGEESGKLHEVLRVVSDQLESADELKKKIRGAMIYPAIVITAMVGIGILMMIYVVPTLTATFEQLDVELPMSTQIIIAISDFLNNYTLLALALIAAAVIAVWRALKTRWGSRAFEWLLLHIPIIKNLVKETNAARTARTLSSLLASGVEVVRALSITGDVVQNTYYREVLAEAEERIQKGEEIANVFQEHEDLYPPLMSEMIEVGEETGKLSDMLKELALFYEGEVSRKTEDMSTIVEPFLMIVIGAGVGFFAVSMLTPIYSLSSGI
jgi:type IV pilus assembly protein PilC